jgi:hypothetical protein
MEEQIQEYLSTILSGKIRALLHRSNLMLIKATKRIFSKIKDNNNRYKAKKFSTLVIFNNNFNGHMIN